ncbi:MAG: hypothetical protein ACLGPM_07650 [Acidobacteriota bacterium]
MPEEIVKPPQIVVPVNLPAMTPEEAAKGERTVPMIFDGPVHLTVEANRSIHFPRGIHPVAVRYSNHWYLKAHNVREYREYVPAGNSAEQTQRNASRANDKRNNGKQNSGRE